MWVPHTSVRGILTMRYLDAQLVRDVERRTTGGNVHAVRQLLATLPMLIAVHNSPRCTERAAVALQIDDLESRLYALAHRR